MLREIAAAILFLSVAVPTQAATIFSNLASDGSFDCCTGWTVFGSAFPISTDRAVPFAPSANYALDSIDLALTLVQGNNAADVWLMSDAGGLPDTILESFHLTNLPIYPTSTGLATANSALHPLLMAGVQYWVAASAEGDTYLSFNRNLIGDTGLASRDDDGPWGGGSDPFFVASAVRVNGTLAAAPEPTSVLLVATGVTCLFVKTRQRQNRRSNGRSRNAH